MRWKHIVRSNSVCQCGFGIIFVHLFGCSVMTPAALFAHLHERTPFICCSAIAFFCCFSNLCWQCWWFSLSLFLYGYQSVYCAVCPLCSNQILQFFITHRKNVRIKYVPTSSCPVPCSAFNFPTCSDRKGLIDGTDVYSWAYNSGGSNNASVLIQPLASLCLPRCCRVGGGSCFVARFMETVGVEPGSSGMRHFVLFINYRLSSVLHFGSFIIHSCCIFLLSFITYVLPV